MKPFNLRPLLWFDCAAAAIAGTATLALAGLLAPLFGLPRVVVVFVGLVNLAYGAFSFSLARQPSPGRGRVRALVAANLLWVGVCVVMAVYFASPGSWLGASYILAEGFFVGVLATVEARTLKSVE
jgi:predicted membrane-bound spermidine synthase